MRIGIYGGSFNPPHLGHLIVVDSVQDQLQFDKIIFIPAATPPHKIEHTLAPANARLDMTSLAVKHHPVFEVSDLEIRRGGYSYTVDTLNALTVLYPKTSFSLIIGADNFLEIETWKSLDQILALADLVVMNRAEYPVSGHPSRYVRLAKFIQVPAIGISSTDIRLRVKQGRSIRYLVPTDVERYISHSGLYRE